MSIARETEASISTYLVTVTLVERRGEHGVETRYEEIEGANHFTVIAPLADTANPIRTPDTVWIEEMTWMDVRDALKIMRAEKVRRLPVISANGTLEGIVSMNDIVLHAAEAQGRKMPELSYEDVVQTMKEICDHRRTSAAAELSYTGSQSLWR